MSRCTSPSGPAASRNQPAARVNDSVANSLHAAPSVPGRRPDAATHAARPASRSVTSFSIARRTRRSRTSGSSSDADTVGAGGGTRVRLGRAEQPFAVADATGQAALVGERDEHHLPAAVDLADPPLVADADVVVEGDVRALAGQGADGLDLDAGRVHGHEEEGEAGVLGPVGVRPREQQHPVGFLGHAREHLLAVDTPGGAVPIRLAGPDRPRAAPRRRRSPSRVRCSPGRPPTRRRAGGGAPRPAGSRCPPARSRTRP